MKNMNIAIVSLQFEKTATGGGGVHVGQITSEFIKMGHKVTILSIHTKKTISDSDLNNEKVPFSSESRDNLEIIRFMIEEDIDQPYVGTKKEELNRIKSFCDVCVKYIKENQEKFDVVNLHGHHLIPGYMAKELVGIKPKRISYLHALETTYVTKDGNFVGAYEGTKEILGVIREWEAMCRYADFIIGNSPIVNEEVKGIIAEYDDDPEKYYSKIRLIASGCNKDFLMSDEEVKNKLSVQPDIINMVTFCRIDPSKGVEYSIEGAKEAAKISNNRYKLTIAGIPATDEYIRKLKKIAENIPENLEVEFLILDSISSTEEKKKILDNKHIYILPTLKEPFGMSLIEASARGNIIVSAETNGPKYMFESDKYSPNEWGILTARGILAKITDKPKEKFTKNIGKAISYVADNWKEASSRVLSFNDKIRKTWTWEGISKQYIELFKS